MTCDYVTRYLDGFLDEGTRRAFDVERVSEHVRLCSHLLRPDRAASSGRSRSSRRATSRRRSTSSASRSTASPDPFLRERKDPEDNTENVVPVAGESRGLDARARPARTAR